MSLQFRFVLSVVAAACFAVLSAGCTDFAGDGPAAADADRFGAQELSGEDPLPPEQGSWDQVEAPQLREGVRSLDSFACVDDVIPDEEGLELRVLSHCDVGSAFWAGVDGVFGTHDGGYVRTITGVDDTLEGWLLHTQPASLNEMVWGGGFYEDVQFMAARSLLNFSGKTLFSGTYDGVDVQLTFGSGSIDISPELVMAAEWGCADGSSADERSEDCSELLRAHTSMGLRYTLGMELRAQIAEAVSISGGVTLARLDYPFTFDLGVGPVSGVLEMEIQARYSASASAAVTATMGHEVTGLVGVEAGWSKADGWDLVLNPSGEAGMLLGPELALTGGLNGRVSIRAEARIKFLGIFGPNAWVEPALVYNAQASCTDIDWRFYAAVDVGLGVRLDFFMLHLSKEVAGWDWEQDLGSGNIPLPVTLGTNCDDDSPPESVPHTPHVPGPGECRPTGAIAVGGFVSGDTSFGGDFSADLMDAYPVAVGNYGGREAVYSFTAPHAGEVTFRLVDPVPTEVNHDVFILAAEADSCSAQRAVAWGFNSASAELLAGETVMAVIDGYAGDNGFYMLEAQFE
jgi:hypothetical protein